MSLKSNGTFITNFETKNLKDRLDQLILASKQLKFLVGFFYFSGIQELYNSLQKAFKSNPELMLKILVGLNTDHSALGLIEYELDQNSSRDTIVKEYFSSIKKAINSESFDNKEFYEQINFFLDLIQKENLVIRKTNKPNHAKLYLFDLDQSQVINKCFITGSSNLTRYGLSMQREFNIEVSDYGYTEAEKFFDELWEDSIEITENKELKQKLIDTLKHETIVKEVTPYEAYLIVLKSYIDIFGGKNLDSRIIKLLQEKGYKLYQYQLDAVSQALSVIEQNNGVIIADVVGLGKTIIACLIAAQLKERGIVIAPPGIVGNKTEKDTGWYKYLKDFKLISLGWEAHSSGELENIAKSLEGEDDVGVVIVDEAHRFRNEDTKSYDLLSNICKGKKVILLTATPFNNNPSDIFALLHLFIAPKQSRITLSDNLSGLFSSYSSMFNKLAYIKRYYNSKDINKKRQSEKYYKDLFDELPIDLSNVNRKASFLAQQIKKTIEPIIIRRNRLDLKENPKYKNEVEKLSKVEDPIEWFYELTDEQLKFYDEIITCFDIDSSDFKGAIYQPYIYEKGTKTDTEKDPTREENFQLIQQKNLYDFMRRLLVKRFESSFGAFKQSIENFKNITEHVQKFIQNTHRYILDRSLLEKIYEKDIDDIEEALKDYTEKLTKNELPKNNKIYEIDKFKYKEMFLNDIEDDIKLFGNILQRIEALNLEKADPKLDCLIKNIKNVLEQPPKNNEPKRKIIIFSEYRDTVKYLAPKLKKHFDNRVLVIEGTLSKSHIEKINQNFDASNKAQKDDYDILLCTDKISEGFNLNRAGMVINYDIPWNPVRVIQRLGRINRISKKVFDSLYIVNFFPTQKGAEHVKSREIAANKMFLIHNALGEDSKIFAQDEEPSASDLYRKIQQNPEELEELSFFTKVQKEFESLKSDYEALIGSYTIPPRIKVAKASNKNEQFVVIKKGGLFINYKNYDTQDDIQTKSFEEVYDSIKASKEEKRLALSDKFWDYYEQLKTFKETKKPKLQPEHSIAQKAFNKLKSLSKASDPNLNVYKNFIEMLIEDIKNYETLSQYTLRRIANINEKNPTKDLEELKRDLGENYLDKYKNKTSPQSNIIISIENQRKT